MLPVAVDAMGGDHAPEEVVIGAIDWARTHSNTDLILVGDEPRGIAFAGQISERAFITTALICITSIVAVIIITTIIMALTTRITIIKH